MSADQQVVIAITRRVKPGRESEFESALREFFVDAADEGSTEDQFLMRPVDRRRQTYGVLRAFASNEAKERFYHSDVYRRWLETVEPLVDGDAVRRELHGLEAFFPEENSGHPPRWKMAFVTWLGVFPMVLLWAGLLKPMTTGMHQVRATAIVTAMVVISLSWAVMPLLIRIFKPMLQPRPKHE